MLLTSSVEFFDVSCFVYTSDVHRRGCPLKSGCTQASTRIAKRTSSKTQWLRIERGTRIRPRLPSMTLTKKQIRISSKDGGEAQVNKKVVFPRINGDFRYIKTNTQESIIMDQDETCNQLIFGRISLAFCGTSYASRSQWIFN